jgi:serine/threonine-protein kinase
MPAHETTRDALTPEPIPDGRSSVFEPGMLLSGAYLVRRVLGAGGMGQVFEANDLVLGRRVAIKAHWRHMQHLSIREEARALAAIRHPAIAVVHGIGTHEGVDYVVMERLVGVTLADQIARRRDARQLVPIREALDILALLAEGLGAVHAAGVAHRDVKPSNVMLAAGGRLVLMDFGIVLPEYAALGGEAMPGTIDYMPPEAIMARVSPGRAYLFDVYAFGVVAHQLLTNELPFDASNTFEVVQKHLREPPATLTRLRPDVPPALEGLIASCLAKDPDDRPSSMDLVATTLRTIRPRATRSSFLPLTVLVVEDDPAFAKVLASIVRDSAEGAHVSVVHDGEAALEHLRRNPPDLLLLDLGLPGMNGLELCMFMRGSRIAEGTTIVSVSAAARATDVALLRQLGVRHFVRKDEHLVEKLEGLVQALQQV